MTYLTKWNAIRRTSRLIEVYSYWNFNGKEIERRPASSSTLTEEIIEYDIKDGKIDGMHSVADGAILYREVFKLPDSHKLIIKAFEGGVLKDEESMDTVRIPPSFT